MIKLVIKPLVYKSQAESLYRDCCILSETEECLSVVVFLTVEWLEQAQQRAVTECDLLLADIHTVQVKP